VGGSCAVGRGCAGDAEAGTASTLDKGQVDGNGDDGNGTAAFLAWREFFFALPDAFFGGCNPAAARVAVARNERAAGWRTADNADETAACSDCDRDQNNSKHRSNSLKSKLSEGKVGQ
jgi:hypothetical protein